ncbi:MAG: hypothetical protein AAGA80_13500 [Cyanobacteria bacterium P01_F01_bin.143]
MLYVFSRIWYWRSRNSISSSLLHKQMVFSAIALQLKDDMRSRNLRQKQLTIFSG